MVRRIIFISLITIFICYISNAVIGTIILLGEFPPPSDGEFDFTELSAAAPLSTIKVTKRNAIVIELFLRLKQGIHLEKVVDMHLFDGFEPQMTREAAAARLGPPAGQWEDTYYRVQAPFYVRDRGRVSLCLVPGSFFSSRWNVVGYPKYASLPAVFIDANLLKQVSDFITPGAELDVHVLRSIGWGGLSAHVVNRKCTCLFITAREGQE